MEKNGGHTASDLRFSYAGLYTRSQVDQDCAWRVQMGLGFHEKKMEAIWPLTSDFHMLAFMEDPIKHQPVNYWDQDCAWRVHMGLGFNEKKWRPYGL